MQHALDVQQKIKRREAAEKTKKEPTSKKRIASEAVRPESDQKQQAKKRKTGSSSVAQKKQKTGPSSVAQKKDKGKSTLTETTATATSAIPRKNKQKASEMVIPKKKRSQIVDLGKTLASNPIPKKKNAPTSADGEGHAKVWASQPPVPGNEVNQNVRRGSNWHARSRKPKDRYMELDANQATAVNASCRPTLSKSRREIADQKSIVSDKKVSLVVRDLLEHVGNAEENDLKKGLIARKAHFKRKFSEVTTADFQTIWTQAKNKFYVDRVQVGNKESSKTPVVDLSGGEKHGVAHPAQGTVNRSRNETQTETGNQSKPKDRWAELFLGPLFCLGNEFKFEA